MDSITVSTAAEVQDFFHDGDILVCHTTGPDMIGFIEKAGAIIVEEGGLTSHAAIVGLHFGVPTIVGATNACRLIDEGEAVTVDASSGVVYKGMQTFA